MKQYIVELTKTIIVNVEAHNKKEAIDRVIVDDSLDDFNGAWNHAEPRATVLGIDE